MKVIDFEDARLMRDVLKARETIQANVGYGPVSIYDQDLAKNPGAVGGYDQTEKRDLTAAPGAPASMRRVLEIRCGGCGHEWTAPNVGYCPRCHGSEVTAQTEHECILKRV